MSSSPPLLVINKYPAPTFAEGGVARRVGLEIVKLPTVSSLENVFPVSPKRHRVKKMKMRVNMKPELPLSDDCKSHTSMVPSRQLVATYWFCKAIWW